MQSHMHAFKKLALWRSGIMHRWRVSEAKKSAAGQASGTRPAEQAPPGSLVAISQRTPSLHTTTHAAKPGMLAKSLGTRAQAALPCRGLQRLSISKRDAKARLRMSSSHSRNPRSYVLGNMCSTWVANRLLRQPGGPRPSVQASILPRINPMLQQEPGLTRHAIHACKHLLSPCKSVRMLRLRKRERGVWEPTQLTGGPGTP